MNAAQMFAASFITVVGLAACGAEIEPSPGAANSPSAGTSSSGGSSSTSPGGAEGVTKDDETVAAIAVIRNTSTSPRWIVVDAQSTPVDFHVGDPPVQLNGYGSYWCGGPTTNHNDPMARVVRVEPGARADIYWRPIAVTDGGGCWKGTPLAPGAYPTKACVYDSDPGAIRSPGMTSSSVQLTCVETTLVVPAGGAAATLDL